MKNGVFKEYFKDESLSCVGEYVNSEKDGEGELYDEGEYINDKKTDEWKTYNATGTLNKKKFYKENLDNF